jgi:hypothetical protein
MHWRASLLGCIACSGCGSGGSSPRHVPAEMEPSTVDGVGRDRLGVQMLNASLPGGMEWYSAWDTRPRSFRGVDPMDAWFDADHGTGEYVVPGDGTLLISGETPRMYVHDPALLGQWRDIEITVYFMRVRDSGVQWGGMVGVARTNHGTTGDEDVDKCDTRGLSARMRYDGNIDFEKETNHPDSEATAEELEWPGGMPFQHWLGYKYVVYDLPDGRVRQELWLDSESTDVPGRWQRVDSFEDDGSRFGKASSVCRAGIAATLPLTNASARAGSESGKPNITVYFRSDGVGQNGLEYKWASIREIAPGEGSQ